MIWVSSFECKWLLTQIMSNQNIAPMRPPVTAAGMIGLPMAIQIPSGHPAAAQFNNNNSYSSSVTPHPTPATPQLLRPPMDNGQDAAGAKRKKGKKIVRLQLTTIFNIYFYCEHSRYSCLLLLELFPLIIITNYTYWYCIKVVNL